LNIAYSHELLSDYASTLALVIRAESLASSALKAIASSKQPELDSPLKLDVDEAAAKSLQSHLAILVHQYNGLVDLHRTNEQSRGLEGKDKISQVPVIHRLNEYPAGVVDLTHLVTYPPKLEPVPVKPLFLDLAWNYIEYPGQAEAGATSTKTTSAPKAEEQKESTKEKPKKGWFGFGGS
jgi:signal recognition particle subunit SRP68